jgi:hypothetical protein
MILQLLVAQSTVNPLEVFWLLFLMVIIGSIIIWVVGALIFFIPAFVVAGAVWYITGNPDFTGVAFLVIAVLSLLRR